MAVPREVIRVPRLRGLHDFPEQAPMGSAAEALNVEFVDGGVSRRRGSLNVRNIALKNARLRPRITGKGIWSWRDVNQAVWHIVAYTEHAVATSGYGYVEIGPAGGAPLQTFELALKVQPNIAGSHWGGRNNMVWTGIPFRPAGRNPDLPADVFIIGADGNGGVAPHWAPTLSTQLWCIFWDAAVGQFDIRPISVIDRADDDPARPGTNQYWGGGVMGVPGLAQADDAPPYFGGATINEAAAGKDRGLVGGRIVTVYRGRLVSARSELNGQQQTLRWSNVGDLTLGETGQDSTGGFVPVVLQGWPAHNFVQLEDADDSPITGLTTWRDFLLIFKERSLQLARFSGIEDFQILQQSFGAGHVGAGPPVQIRYRGKDLVFFMSDDGIYAWDGKVRYMSGPIEKRLRSRGFLRNAIGFAHPDAGQVWWLAGRGSGATPRWMVLDLDSGDWSEMEYGGDFDACGLLDEGFSQKAWPHVIGADQSGVHSLNVAKVDIGESDGTHDATAPFQNFEARWESQRIAYGKHQVRRWRHLRLDQEQTGQVANVQVWWALDNQDRGTQVAAGGQNVQLPTQPGAPGTFGTLTFGNALFVAGDGQYFHSRVHLYGGPARWFRFGIENSSAQGPRWHVTSAEVDTRRMEGRR